MGSVGIEGKLSTSCHVLVFISITTVTADQKPNPVSCSFIKATYTYTLNYIDKTFHKNFVLSHKGTNCHKAGVDGHRAGSCKRGSRSRLHQDNSVQVSPEAERVATSQTHSSPLPWRSGFLAARATDTCSCLPSPDTSARGGARSHLSRPPGLLL